MKFAVVVSGPSGSGKSTLLKKLFEKYNHFAFSVSHCTRAPRKGELDKVSYHFTDPQSFKIMLNENKFIETAEFSGNYYGTSYEAIKTVQDTNKICVLDLEVKGVQSIKKTQIKALFVFIQPPSLEILEQRLRNRNTETEESLQKRLASAQEAFDYANTPGSYDIKIINDDQDVAFKELDDFVSKHFGFFN